MYVLLPVPFIYTLSLSNKTYKLNDMNYSFTLHHNNSCLGIENVENCEFFFFLCTTENLVLFDNDKIKNHCNSFDKKMDSISSPN